MQILSLFTSCLILLCSIDVTLSRTQAFIPARSISQRVVVNRIGDNMIYAGPAIMEPPPTIEKEKVTEKKKSSEKNEESYSVKRGGWAVRLFNDPFNKREFVAMCLSKIVGLTDGQSYQVMMQAHKNGLAVVGRFDLERAELYKTALNENGLMADMIPVEDD
jgi:ATP-dependent Clp protease adaptor protein ClpS